jgi:predicted permease
VRLLLTESTVLSLLGGLLGIGIAFAFTKSIQAIDTTLLPAFANPSVDARVLGYSLLVSIVTGLVFGLAPALEGARVDVQRTLKNTGRGSVAAGGERLRRGLVVAQIALAAVLLVSAGLLMRSFQALRHVPTGFDPANVLTARATTSGPRYRSNAAINTFFDAVFTDLRATPGVVAVGAVSGLPLVGSSGCGLVKENDAIPPGERPEVRCMSARGDYFRAMGTPLLRGRMFDATDRADGPQVVVVNESMARRFWPNQDPIGKRVRLGPNPSAPWETVVGVVGDIRQTSLQEDPKPTVFENDVQHGWGGLTIVIRTTGDPLRAAPALRTAVRQADPQQAVRSVMTMDEILAASLARRRFSLALFACFGVTALVLATVGVYGVLSYAVSSRTQEFGVRMALGANATQVMRVVLSDGLRWAGLGLTLGLVGAVGAGRALRGSLYTIAPTDVTTYAIVAVTLAGVATLACVIPGLRATRVDPNVALRGE